MVLKKIFKATDSVSDKMAMPEGYIPGERSLHELPTEPSVSPTVSPTVIDDIQDQIDDIVDEIENDYYVDYVFDKYDYFISTHPFYFYFEIPIGMSEIVSARVSFEVKDYRNALLTHSRYAITGDPTTRPVITFYVSEDKKCLFGDAYGPYTTDMRAIDILGDLTYEGIKVIKFTTDVDACVTARVFLRLKIKKSETPGYGVFERPEVRTLAATSIIGSSAALNGDIIKTGAGTLVNRSTGQIEQINECTKRGFKYATTKTDTNDKSETGTFVRGAYSLTVTGLTPSTDYYYRAYAKNDVGISYGEYVKFTTTAGCDVSKAVYESKSYDVTSEESTPHGLFFSSDGTKMYIIGVTSDRVSQYTLSTAWDVSTATYASKYKDISEEGNPSSVFFKSDGLKMYIVGWTNDTVYQYTLSSAWDVSTASYDTKSCDVSNEEGNPRGLFFSSDGTKMYVVGINNDTVYQYTLSSAWDVSTATYASKSKDVGNEETDPNGLSFNSDGTKMYILGIDSDIVYQYALSTGWDVSTATHSSVLKDVSNEAGIPMDLYVKSNCSGMYVLGATYDKVYQYYL